MSKIQNQLGDFGGLVDDLSISIEDFNCGNISLLLNLFSRVHDSRIKSLIKYEVPDLLALVFIAKIKMKVTSFVHIADYIRADRIWLKELGLLKGDECPSHDTIRRMFMMLDGDYLQKIFINKIDGVFKLIHDKYIDDSQFKYNMKSIDGKEFRGSGRCATTKKPAHNVSTLNIYDVGTKCCIYSMPISKKENEITALKDIMPSLHLANTIVTADALHCQRDMCSKISRKRGFYVLTAKDNQRELKTEIENRFDKYNKENSCTIGTISEDKTAKREFQILDLNSNYIGVEWPSVKTYIRMISHVKDKNGVVNKTPQYFISSLKDHEAIIEAIERRWEIEDDYHKFKDEYLFEDTCRFQDKNAIKNMAIINGIIYSFFKVCNELMGQKETLGVLKIQFQLRPIESILLVLSQVYGRSLSTLINEKRKAKNDAKNVEKKI